MPGEVIVRCSIPHRGCDGGTLLVDVGRLIPSLVSIDTGCLMPSWVPVGFVGAGSSFGFSSDDAAVSTAAVIAPAAKRAVAHFFLFEDFTSAASITLEEATGSL